MLELNFLEWKNEFERIVDDTYGITVPEFCGIKLLPKYYKLGYSPLEAFEELDDGFSPEDTY